MVQMKRGDWSPAARDPLEQCAFLLIRPSSRIQTEDSMCDRSPPEPTVSVSEHQFPHGESLMHALADESVLE
jgi:hypothetical protein